MWHFLGEWLWQAINWPLTIVGFIGFILSLLSAWLLPKMWRNRVKPWRDKALLPITGILILIGLIWAPYHIYNQLDQAGAEHNPMLKFEKATTVSISNDLAHQIAYGNITFWILNNGNDAAYDTRSRICVAPAKNLRQIYSYDDLVETNPLMPTDEVFVPTSIRQPFTESNGTLSIQFPEWLIYYQLRYSNAPTDGRWSTYDYYFVLSFNTGLVRDALPTEKQAFAPLVKAYYGNET